MGEILPGPEPMDRREQVIVTRQPGYEESQHVVRDLAQERRLGMWQITRLVWLIAGILEILLGLRFLLKLIAANPNSGFAAFIYGLSALFMGPFSGLTASPSAGGMVLEVPTLIAMAVYALFFWIVVRVLWLVFDQPSARMVSSTVRQTPVQRAVSTETDKPIASQTTTTTDSAGPTVERETTRITNQ